MRKHLLTSLALCAALVAAAPAMADRDGYRGHHGHHHGRQRVVYHENYYVPVRYYAPRPVYYAPRPVYYAPRPVYVVDNRYPDYAAARWIGGAIVAGAILHQLDHHH